MLEYKLIYSLDWVVYSDTCGAIFIFWHKLANSFQLSGSVLRVSVGRLFEPSLAHYALHIIVKCPFYPCFVNS